MSRNGLEICVVLELLTHLSVCKPGKVCGLPSHLASDRPYADYAGVHLNVQVDHS